MAESLGNSLIPEYQHALTGRAENVPLKSHFQDYLDFEADCSGIFDNMDIKTAKQIIQKIQP